MTSLAQVGLHKTLKLWAEKAPNNLAIVAPDRLPLNYRQLWQQIQDLVIQFNAIGIGRNDRVAIALPNSPEMAVAFLASSSCATCAPLNPGYKAPEFDFYLQDLQAKVLIVQAGVDSPAIAVAQNLHIPIVELSPLIDAPAGMFTLKPRQTDDKFPDMSFNQSLDLEHQGFAAPADTALVLHTSGTTSRPKIVPLSHQNLSNSAANISDTLQLTPGDRCLNVMPLFHIHGLIACLLSSMQAGASVVCTPGFDAPNFFDWLKEFQPTWYSCVPTMHQGILARSAANQEIIQQTPIRLIRSSSAALAPAVMAEIEAVFQAPVIEAYGMTEASHQMASNPLGGQRKPGSVGLAAGPEVGIMDEAGNLLALGAIGEIVIRGENVTAGYENNPTANATAYSNGWFRTGDQGYLDQDNYLFIKDRIKEIINRGGEKISPREVDEIIFSHTAIAQAVTFATPHAQLGEEVAVAVVLHPEQSVTEREVQEFAAIHLADFKIPRRVIFLDEIPKGATGKFQRIGLAEKLGLIAPESTTFANTDTGITDMGITDMGITDTGIAATGIAATGIADNGISPSTTPLETALAEIWSTVLKVEKVNLDDEFFELGGDSLLAAQIINRVQAELNLELSIFSFWECDNLGEMAAELASQAPMKVASIQSTNQSDIAVQNLGDIADQNLGDRPLSFTQSRLWFLDQLAPGEPLYNQSIVIRLPSAVDIAILEQSLQEIIRRHVVIRSQFLMRDGEPHQETLPGVPLKLTTVKVDDSRTALNLARDFARIPFDLTQGNLIRGSIFQINSEAPILLLMIHHIVCDGWSVGVLLRELNALYPVFAQGLPSPLPELSIQYGDFALWQRQWLQGEVLATQLDFWTKHLEGAPPLLELPYDRPRPPQQTFRGAKVSLRLPPTLGNSLIALSRRSNITLSALLLTAFGTLLHRYSGAKDLVIGCPVAGRTRRETEDLIGVFINTMPLRLRFEENPLFSDLLQQVQKVSLEALAYQDLPLEKLVEALQPERNASYHPLFQVGFIFAPPKLGGDFSLARDFLVHNGTSKFDLSLAIEETPGEIINSIDYSTDLFDADTIARMLEHWQILLEGIVADSSQPVSALPLLAPTEQQRLLVEWNSNQSAYPQDQCIHELFAAQVERSPDAIAVVCQDQSLTYRELNNRANQLAHYLQSLGVKPEVLVGICVDRSLEMIIGFLGILKAGGAYLPLDPTYPTARLAYMINDAQIGILLTQSEIVDRLPETPAQIICLDPDKQFLTEYSLDNPSSPLQSTNLAYIIYTSGSTGKPKGVMIQHQSVVNFLQAIVEEYNLQPSDRFLQFASGSFDVAVEEIFATLSCGATLVLRTDEMLSSVRTFLETCQAWQISVFHLPTVFWNQLTSAIISYKLTLPPSLRLVITGGERASAPQWNLWLKHVGNYPVLVNSYGPTETTVGATRYPLSSLDSSLDFPGEIPLGRAIANTTIYVLDDSQQLVPIGVVGQLHIGGAGLARGYLNQSDLTLEKFVPNPFGAGKLYKTGDLGRYLPDGNIEYWGRIDHQVKLRGFRIELGEIEAILASHPLVQEVVVVTKEDTPGEQQLVAYLVFKSRQEPNPETDKLNDAGDLLVSTPELQSYLRDKLPDYMIPSIFVPLSVIPLTPNGKVDRRALPNTSFQPSISNYLAPRNELELAIALIWSEVLQLEKIGATDNFFDLGGHSLSAIRVMTRLQENLGISISLRSLFQFPTVEAFALQVEALRYVQGAKTNLNLDLNTDTEYEEFEL